MTRMPSWHWVQLSLSKLAELGLNSLFNRKSGRVTPRLRSGLSRNRRVRLRLQLGGAARVRGMCLVSGLEFPTPLPVPLQAALMYM